MEINIDSQDSPRLITRLRSEIRVRHYSTGQNRLMSIGSDAIFSFTISATRKRWCGRGKGFSFAFGGGSKSRGGDSESGKVGAAVFVWEVLKVELPWLDEVIAAKNAKRLPVVLTQVEVRDLLNAMSGTMGLIASLLYGAGMRLLEGLRLRIKDVEFARREIIVRAGKGNKDRVTVLPENVLLPLKAHLQKVKALHERDLDAGFGEVYLPNALALKYPNAAKAWGWQYVFPSSARSEDPRSESERRHHILDTSVQRAVREAAGSPIFISLSRRTCCGIHLRLTCCRPVMTSAPFRNYSATRMCKPP